MEHQNDIPDTTDDNQNEVNAQPDESLEQQASDEQVVQVDESENLHLLLEDARSKADEHWEMVIRARAEAENLKKRHARELENAHKFAIDKFVSELLPVRDSLELGLNAGAEEGADMSSLIEGTALTLKLFTDVMGKFGIQEINPQGEPFNPEFHQAMAMQPSNDVPPNTVITVIQKGYTLNNRLVRPAMVMVSQAAS